MPKCASQHVYAWKSRPNACFCYVFHGRTAARQSNASSDSKPSGRTYFNRRKRCQNLCFGRVGVPKRAFQHDYRYAWKLCRGACCCDVFHGRALARQNDASSARKSTWKNILRPAEKVPERAFWRGWACQGVRFGTLTNGITPRSMFWQCFPWPDTGLPKRLVCI